MLGNNKIVSESRDDFIPETWSCQHHIPVVNSTEKLSPYEVKKLG